MVAFVVGADTAARRLRTVSVNLRFFNPAFHSVGDQFREYVRKQFMSGGYLSGISNPWAPLAERTRRDKHGTAKLIETRGLLRSWTVMKSPGNIADVRGSRALFGSGYRARSNVGKIVPVAMFHQVGTQRHGKVYMPERPITLVHRALEEDIVDTFMDHLFKDWYRVK